MGIIGHIIHTLLFYTLYLFLLEYHTLLGLPLKKLSNIAACPSNPSTDTSITTFLIGVEVADDKNAQIVVDKQGGLVQG